MIGVDLNNSMQLKKMFEELNGILYIKLNSITSTGLNNTKRDLNNWYVRLLDVDAKYNLSQFMGMALEIDAEKHANAELIIKILDVIE